MTTSVTSLLLPGGKMLPPMAGGVVNVESTATTYELCLEGFLEGKCMGKKGLLTLGPWAEKDLPSGAEETGALDFRDADKKKTKGFPYSIHCDMTRSTAELCYDVVLDEDNGEVLTRTHNPKAYGDPEFGYAKVTLTSGLEKLNAEATDATTGGPSKTGSGPEETGTGSKGQDGDDDDEDGEGSDDDNGVASRLPSVLAAAFAAGVALVFAF